MGYGVARRDTAAVDFFFGQCSFCEPHFSRDPSKRKSRNVFSLLAAGAEVYGRGILIGFFLKQVAPISPTISFGRLASA